MLILLKTNFLFKNRETYQSKDHLNGLNYSDLAIEDLVSKDSDGDGVVDWEESLFGTDPTKKETTAGTPDKVTIDKIKASRGGDTKNTSGSGTGDENLTKTEQFSRELFATIAAASQGGTMDPASIEAITTSLAEKIKNPIQRKTYLNPDLKISTDESKESVRKYADALDKIQKIYTVNYTVLDVLQKFIVDDNNVDSSVLSKLDPIISQTEKVIDVTLKTSVPKSLSVLHLNVINSLQRLVENLKDIQLYDTDVIIAFGAINQYNNNANTLEVDMGNLQAAVELKLNN